MQRIFKGLSLCMVLVLSLGLLSACGQKGADNQSTANNNENNSKKQETKTLDFVWFSDGVEGDVTKEIIKDYQQNHSNVEFNMIEIPYKDLETKLKVMISGGEPPALARLTNIGMFKNSLEDISKYLEDKDKFISQFSDSLQNYYIIDGKILAAPIDVTANGLLYNKTAFEKAGVEVPASPDEIWTWDEWVEVMKKVMKDGGVRYGLVFDKTPHRWSTLLYQNGGRMLSEDGKKVLVNSQEAVETVDFFVKLHKEGIIPDSVWLGSENPNNLFRTGQVAMHFSGSWMMTNYRDNIKDFEWGVTYMPKGKIRSSVPGGKYIGTFKNSGNEKEAAEFIEFFTSKEVNAKYCKESLFISPRKDNAELDYPFGKEFFKVFANELNATSGAASKDWADSTVIPKIGNDVRDAIIKVLAGEATAQEALNEVAEKGQEILDEAN